jgi:hypothetical protein
MPTPRSDEEVTGRDILDGWRRITSSMSEQQRLNWTEAALIKYFAPPYNKEYKKTFPSPAHKTYSDCYDLDLNTVGFVLDTSEVLGVKLYSEAPRSWRHIGQFVLHSIEERRSMFDFSSD